MTSLGLALYPFQCFRSVPEATISEALTNTFSTNLNDMSHVEDVMLLTARVSHRPMFNEVVSMLFNSHPAKLLSCEIVRHYPIHLMRVEAISGNAGGVR